MFCAISGTVPEEPVLSKTGYLFEKKLILKHIEATGKCPITNETLTPDDLTPIKTSSVVKPRPTTATSIPSMLHMFQNEWDAVMLECFALKQNLEQVRQELAHALYQNDAACRVIARLVKERDAARSALANAQAQLSTAPHAPATSENASAMEVEAPTRISDEIKEKMTALSKQLSQQRKKRAPPATLAQIPDIEQFKERSSHPVHKSNLPGITCLDIHPTNPHVTITGGVDKTAVVFNEETGKKTATLSGHAKKVTQVLFHPTEDLVFTASSDKTARVWKQQAEAYDTASVIKTHSGAVVALTLHPLGDYIVTASADCTWGFHDIHSGACLSLVSDQSGKAGYQCASFHPDGLILATGTADSMVRIWDVKSQGNVANFEGHRGSISSLAFSENGYILATAADDATVKLWDLRKLKNFHTLDLGGVVANLHFDFSGSYLGAAAGNDIKIYNTKSLEIITTLSGHSDAVTALKFGPDASFIASTSMDRSLKFWSKS